MANESEPRRRLRYEDIEPGFQRRWRDARHLSAEQVDRAFRHGFDARDRFADRPFEEVTDYLRESWSGMAPETAWSDVADIVRSGYERRLDAEGQVSDGP